MSEQEVNSVRRVLTGILMDLGEKVTPNQPDEGEGGYKIPETVLAPFREKLYRLIQLVQQRGRSMREGLSQNRGLVESYSPQREALDAAQILSDSDLQVLIKTGLVYTLGCHDAGELDLNAKSALIRTSDGQIHSVTIVEEGATLQVNLPDRRDIR